MIPLRASYQPTAVRASFKEYKVALHKMHGSGVGKNILH